MFWYYLEGLDPDGEPIGGWDSDELRSLQDWEVRYALLAADGVAEVASIGGFVRQYQVDVDPDALRAHGVTLAQVVDAVRRYGRVFQIGTQQRSSRNFRYACELVRNGYLGKLKRVEVGVPGGRSLPNAASAPVPADIDYEMWLGPAPYGV